MEQIHDNESISGFEVELTRTDGSRFPAEVNMVFLQHYGQQDGRAVISLHDLTRRNQIIDELREKTFFLQNIFLMAGEGILVTDAQGYIVSANHMAENIFCCPEQELIGGHFPGLVEDYSEPGALPPSMARLLSEGSLRDHVTRYRRSDGTIFSAETNIVLLKDELGNPTGAITTIRDISERKLAEQILQESEKKYRTMFETITDIYFQSDFDGNFYEITPSVERYTGYKPEELVGGSIKTLFFYERPEDRDHLMRELLKKGELLDYELRVLIKNGEMRWASINAHIIRDENNAPASIIGCMRDITGRKHAALELQKKEKLLEAKTSELVAINSALKVLLATTEESKKELEEKILFNVRRQVVSYVEKLKRTGITKKQRSYLEIIETNLNDIVSPFGRNLSAKFALLTPAEIQIANLIREGKTSKDMSHLLHVSERTVDFHRKNIRHKLHIKNKKANLRSLLLSL
jgi:PAS domain S-box-containing protein